MLQLEFEKTTEDLSRGAEALAIPHSVTIEIYPEPTRNMEKNQLLQRGIAEKLGEFFSSIGSAIKSNPASKGYYALGFAILALAGFGLYLWLNGYSDVYFFGMLSLPTLVPMAIYGLSLMYEGWNNSSINEQKKALEKINEEKGSRLKDLESKASKIAVIEETSQKSLSKFKQEWGKYLSAESEKLASVQQEEKEWMQKMQENSVNFVTLLFTNLKKEEAQPGVTHLLKSIPEYVMKQAESI